MTVRRHADGERHLGKPKLQLALTTNNLLSVAYRLLLVARQICKGLEEPFRTRLTHVPHHISCAVLVLWFSNVCVILLLLVNCLFSSPLRSHKPTNIQRCKHTCIHIYERAGLSCHSRDVHGRQHPLIHNFHHMLACANPMSLANPALGKLDTNWMHTS